MFFVKPKHITFTGVDEKTDVIRCIKLSQKYPIEWGILFNGGKNGEEGRNRYPSFASMAKFFMAKNYLHIAGHFCGTDAQNLLKGKTNFPLFEFHEKYKIFERIQVNAIDYNWEKLEKISVKHKIRFIAQHRVMKFPLDEERFDFLFDKSGGKGKTTNSFPIQENEKNFVGYAGGISPDNILETLKNIDAKNYWIDMETGVRTNEWFDLDKCEKICKIVYGE